MAAHQAGVRLGKAVSFGNGIVLENADYLEYFADDPGTDYIAMYVEGLQDGRRFFELLRRATPRKPVVLWKGGRSSDGGRATRSHTASLAGSIEVWDALCRQAGALQARSMTEAVDLLKALTLLPPFAGDGVAVMGGSGGQSVSMTDAFAGAGMRVPELTEASYAQLGEWFSLVGASFRNPIDMGTNRTELDQILEILDGDAHIDTIAMQLRPRPKDDPDRERLEVPVAALARSKERSAKPHFALLHSPTPLVHGEAIRELDAQLHALGIPAFPSYERAAGAVAKVSAYYRWRTDLESGGYRRPAARKTAKPNAASGCPATSLERCPGTAARRRLLVPAPAAPVHHLVDGLAAERPEAAERVADGDRRGDVDVLRDAEVLLDPRLVDDVERRHRRAESERARRQQQVLRRRIDRRPHEDRVRHVGVRVRILHAGQDDRRRLREVVDEVAHGAQQPALRVVALGLAAARARRPARSPRGSACPRPR